MEAAGVNGEVAVTMSGVAPVTLIAQISVALIAVAVTAVYILKHLPDPGEGPGPRRNADRRQVERRDPVHPQESAEEIAQERSEQCVDGSTGLDNGSDGSAHRESSEEPAHSETASDMTCSSPRGEYRAIISHDEYQDLCGGSSSSSDPPPAEKQRTARKKGPLSGKSKEWPTSLESIDEEDEEQEDVSKDENKSRHSPKRGSRVPSWYFSISSSGIPTLPKDRDLDTQFDQLATQGSLVLDQRKPNTMNYEYEDISFVDGDRKKAITGFSGSPIGVLQRKPWPREPRHEYSNIGVTSGQPQTVMESDHAKNARTNFMLKGRVRSFDSTPTRQVERKLSIPDIQIHEPTASDQSSSGERLNYEYLDSNANETASSGSSQWVETLASTVRLPEKHSDELKAEVVHIDLDNEEDGSTEEAEHEDSHITEVPRPIPKPRARIIRQSDNQAPAVSPRHPRSQPDSAPPPLEATPAINTFGFKPITDVDQSPVEERGPSPGAEQPSRNSYHGLHQQTKHGDQENKKSDAALHDGVQTGTGITKRVNIDSSDNSPQSVTHIDDGSDDSVAFKPEARVFTVIGSTPGPINTFRAAVGSSEQNSRQVEKNSPHDSHVIDSLSEQQDTPGGDVLCKQDAVTSRSPYEIGIPSLSTGVSSDEGNLQKVQCADSVSRDNGNTEISHSCKEQETVRVATQTDSLANDAVVKTDSETLSCHGNELNTDNEVGLENEVTDSVSVSDKEGDRDADLDVVRASLTENLPSKRPKELLLNGSSKSPNSGETRRLKSPRSTDAHSSKDLSDSDISSATSPSDIIAQQRARIRRSLEKLNVPDWYKKSNHYNRVLNSDRSTPRDYQSDVEPRMTRSPSSCLSDCWSVTSSEEVSSLSPVSTKIAFQSEARYRRDFPKGLLNEPIRNAFSCAELSSQNSKWLTKGNALNRTSDIDYNDICHSEDNTNVPHSEALNQTSSLYDLNSDSPSSQPSPSHGLRSRSKSEGDSLDQITYFDSLAVKRLERHMYDSIFFVTGYTDSENDLGYDQSDSNSNLASGSLPDESIDDMEYRRQIHQMRESYPLDSASPELPQRPTLPSYINDRPYENGYLEKRVEHDGVSCDYSYKEQSRATTYAETPDLYAAIDNDRPVDVHPQWTPTPAPRRSIRESPSLNSVHQQAGDLKPDPRYNPDGSRNYKVSPRFAMITPQSGGEQDSPRSSPRSITPRKTPVRILVTDTSLEDDDSGSGAGNRSDQDQVSASSSDQETVVDGTTNTWVPLDLEKLKESKFAAVLSVVTSRHMKPGDRSGLYLPGSGFVPPQEVTMEEIVDSLLGLPYQRATSAMDLNSNGYRGSSATSTPLTCSTPDLSSSWSPSRGSTPVSSSEKSHSVDSLFSDDGNVLNSIIVGRRRNEERLGGSYEEGDSDAVGEEIILVKCSYKKCARTKELADARKSFKTCHNCYTYYCSRQCRKLHWPRHKKRCVFSRVNSACKHVIYHSRYNGQLQSDLTRVARTGYLSRGRGAILLIFPDTDSAENYAQRGFDALPSAPTYSTIRELENSDLFGDHMKFLLEMCRTYNPEKKFVLNVAVMASSEEQRGSRKPRRPETAVKKCAKLSLVTSHADTPSTNPDPVPDTLIITSPSGPQRDGALDRKSRQVCFVHIQRQLRQRGVNLRHQHTEIYDSLCQWVEGQERFIPTTIYPIDEATGKRFMCVLMPESEPDELGWIDNPEILEDIDLDAELEKLENLAGMVVTDL